MSTITAKCSCGGFQFTSTRAPFLQLTCHCLQCRQVSKAPFSNFAFFKLADAESSGETVVHRFTADSGAQTTRETCASCGEMVLDRTEGFPLMIGVVAERIQPPFEFQPRCHVWTERKSPEVRVPEGIKAFARHMQ